MAKGFQFNLEAVLKYRQMREDQARRDFAVVQRIHAEKKGALDRLFTTRETARDEMGRKSGGEVDVKELLRYQRYLNGLRHQIAAAQADLAKVEKELAARREIYEKARRERKVMDNLRERRREEWSDGLRRAEQKETDEVAALLQTRNAGEEGVR